MFVDLGVYLILGLHGYLSFNLLLDLYPDENDQKTVKTHAKKVLLAEDLTSLTLQFVP